MRAIEWTAVMAAVVAAVPAECYAAKRIAPADGLGGRVEVTCVDATTGGEIPQPYVTAEPIDKPLPPGQFPFRLEPVVGQRNTFLSPRLAPGRYQLWAKRDARNPDDDCYESDRPVVVEVNAGETTRAVVRVSKRRLTPKEIKQRWPWEVYGRVSDPSGSPVKGAAIRAHSGMGTLPCTGATLTDAEGMYRLHFTNGGFILDKRAVYYAQVTASKPGMYELNLNLQGQLAAAEPDAEYGHELFRPEQLIYQHRPRRVDFVMSPAADLHIQFHTERKRDEKLDGLRVSLKGIVMPPGCSVVDDGRADRWGWIAFAGVPLEHEWFIEIEAEDETVRTQPFRLTEAQQYSIDLRWRRDATGLEVLDIESIEDALGRDVTLAQVGSDPLTHPPASAAENDRDP